MVRRMEFNLSLADRIFRILTGSAITGLSLALGTWWGLTSLYFFGTGIAGWSPLYYGLGLSTCRFAGPEAVCDE